VPNRKGQEIRGRKREREEWIAGINVTKAREIKA